MQHTWTHACPARFHIKVVTDRNICRWCGMHKPEQVEQVEESNIMTMLDNEEINQRFGHHKATLEGKEATGPWHKEVREEIMETAYYLDNNIPDGREKALMFTKLEEAAMWAHKAIARETAKQKKDE